MTIAEDLAQQRSERLQAEAATRRLVRQAMASREPDRPSPLRTAVGTHLVRVGLWLVGDEPGGIALRVSRR